MTAKPFLKYAGGKTKLVPLLQSHMPATYNHYFEPFVGGGALFWKTSPAKAILSDANESLMNAYFAIRQDVEAVIDLLKVFPYEYRFFCQMRKDFAQGSLVERAARLIYLNRTCFNGLFRVNKQGEFNVPFGRYTNPTICDAETLRACSQALQTAHLRCADFTEATAYATQGDFVYFDPPYLPLSVTSSFTRYTANGFAVQDHIRLRDTALELARRGVHVMISNSSAPAIRDLYEAEFTIVPIHAGRSINRNAEGRAAIEEWVIIPKGQRKS